MTVAALDKIFSRSVYQQAIDLLNVLVALGSIVTSDTVTTTLTTLATERDKH